MAASVNFTFRKGEDIAIDWTILETKGGSAADITGWTFSLKVKRNASDADPSLVTASHSITNAPAGNVTSTIAAAQTAALEGDYVYSLWRTNSGSVSCQAEGFMSFRDTVQS
jgi:hypothetical protein